MRCLPASDVNSFVCLAYHNEYTPEGTWEIDINLVILHFSFYIYHIPTISSHPAYPTHLAHPTPFQTWVSSTYPALVPSVYSMYPAIFRLIVLVLISSCNVAYNFALVIASAGLLFPSIDQISMISRCSYDCHRLIKSTMSHFS